MTWWELLYYFCDYIEERDSLMRGVVNQNRPKTFHVLS